MTRVTKRSPWSRFSVPLPLFCLLIFYFLTSSASRILSEVSSLACSFIFSTREIVSWETPAFSASSFLVSKLSHSAEFCRMLSSTRSQRRPWPFFASASIACGNISTSVTPSKAGDRPKQASAPRPPHGASLLCKQSNPEHGQSFRDSIFPRFPGRKAGNDILRKSKSPHRGKIASFSAPASGHQETIFEGFRLNTP